VKFYDLLDRMGERRLERLRIQPRRPMDVKAFIGLLFLTGYYVMVWRFQTKTLPPTNLALIRDAMLTLGPPVGIIVGALFRSDVRDEIATQNSGKFADAVKEQAVATQAAVAAPAGGEDAATGKKGDPVHTVEETKS
jgi:hypothetical protein